MTTAFAGDRHTLPERELTGLERLRLLGAMVLASLVVGGILVVRGSPTTDLSLGVGDISPRDVTAPRSVTYVSDVLTERARVVAETEVDVVYDAPDATVGRRQVSLAHQTLDRINSIRTDDTLSHEARSEAMSRLEEVTLSPESVALVLSLEDEEWAAMEPEVVRVLEAAMRGVIRDVDLEDARRRVPMLVSFDVPDRQAGLVVELVTDLVAPNTLANEERTADARRRAREAVQPVSVTYQAGQAVVRVGERVTELQLEALRHIGLLEPVREWWTDLSVLGIALVTGLLVFGYIATQEPALGRDWGRLVILGVSTSVMAGVARLMIPGHVLLPYLFPGAALPMLVSVLVSPRAALITCLLPFGFYVGLADGALLELASYGLFGSIAGVLAIGRLRRLKTFIWASGAVMVVSVAMVLIFRLPGGNYDTVGLVSLVGAAVVGAALAGSITTVGYLLVSNFTGAVTSLELLELARPTQPLMREMTLHAPGTYHHSVMVANLAEQAAERVGANALLARVGAYYHDIGKVTRPYFYSENQEEVGNVHDRLDPRSSADIIIGHVSEGVSLARRHRLPAAVVRFISEHHGRSRQDYFYDEAVKRYGAENVDENEFRYPGPRPQTKETAILMLADACEASTRAARPANGQELARLVERIVDDRLLEGELDECPLTLHDIAAIKVSFVNALQGVFHPRVQYPDGSLVEQRPDSRRGGTAPHGVAPAAPASSDGCGAESASGHREEASQDEQESAE